MKAIFEHAVIVGAGLIGASLGAAGRGSGAFGRVTAVGRGRANLEAALELGLVDRVSQDLPAAVADADLVVLAAPVDTSVAMLADVLDAAPSIAVISDVGSVKGPIVREAVRLGAADRFVGAHPMAGGTDTGARAADARLFEGAVCVLTPEVNASSTSRAHAADPTPLDRVRRLWTSVGANVLELTADEHDRAVAEISHLPHMVSFALALTVARSEAEEHAVALAAGGFRDTTRLALSDRAMWTSIARLNREELLAALERFRALLDDVTTAVRDGDDAALGAVIDEAARFRRRLVR